MISQRAAHRGGWPKGRRRNNHPEWPRLRRAILAFFRQAKTKPGRTHVPPEERISRRGCAAALGMCSPHLRKWLDGTCNPPDAAVEQLKMWLAEARRRTR
jgi:hypothetical protein